MMQPYISQITKFLRQFNMEKKYYIAENGNPVGPFTPEELRERGITADTRIYAKGWTDFRDASEIPELAACLSQPKPAASAPSSSASREVGNVAIGAAPSASAPTSAADSSEKELLMRILSHLDELQRENRQLKAEMESMRNGGTPQTPPPPPQTPKKTVATPPPINPVDSTATAAHATEEWDKEWERTANTTVRADKKKGGGNGCLIALIVAALIAIIGCVIYALSQNNNSYATEDSDSAPVAWTYDEYAAPADSEAAAEVAAPAEDYDWGEAAK